VPSVPHGVGAYAMNHTVDTCPLAKIEGGLNPLHEADDDAVIYVWNLQRLQHARNKKMFRECPPGLRQRRTNAAFSFRRQLTT